MGQKKRRNRKSHSRKKKSAAAAETIFLRLLLYSSDKLTIFRIKELKDILSQLGLSKQGKKQDLVDRLIAILSDEQVSRMWAKKNAVGKEEIAKLIEDTHRKVKASLVPDLASTRTSLSDTSDVKPKAEIDDPFRPGSKIRCPCGSSLPTESMIKCEDPRCCVWQHIGCVIIPDKPMVGAPSYPERFYCEICRLGRADPFLVTVGHQLLPVKLNATTIPTDGASPVQSAEKTFQLIRTDKNLLAKQEYDLQAWCMLLNDKVPFRMQWPQYADLHVNGMPIRAINRPGSQLLGINGRDDGPIITPCIKDGINKISLTGCDARVFCLGVRLVKRRSVQQILSLIPKKSDGEPFEDALTRVCRCVNGGTSTDDADSDSDIEVVADSFTVNLRCPMSGSRMKVAGRFKPCLHMGCFDLEVFVEMNQRSRKWQCPICLKNYALEHVIIDPYFNGITTMMLHCGEDVTEVELKSDGSWRVKSKNDIERRDLGDLGLWHFPDCSLFVPAEREKTETDVLKQIKQEGLSEGHPSLKLGIKKNRNGLWEVSQPKDLNKLSSGNTLHERFDLKVIPMSSSATGSGRDDEDPSVNQDNYENFDFSTNNGIELDSNVDPIYGFTFQSTSFTQQGNPDIVILSDSEEEDLLISSGPVYNNSKTDVPGINFPVTQEVTCVSYQNDSILEPGGNSCLGLFNPNDEDHYDMSLWSLPPATQTCSGFQLFSPDKEVTDKLVDVQQQQSMNHYSLDTNTSLRTIAPDTDSAINRSVTDISERLVNNSLNYGAEDPSLQFFLPTRPSNESEQTRLRDEADISNGIHSDDWISLRLGGSSCSGHGESATANRLNSGATFPPREGALDSLADTASFLLGTNDGRSDKLMPKTDGPFSFPRQKRSKRPRLYFSINSDSE